jgi:transposase
MLALSLYTKYYFYNSAVDMRKGCYGLCGIVQSLMKRPLSDGDVFVFLNKRRNQIKLLQWDKDGFAIYEKRLEQGTFERSNLSDVSADTLLTSEQLQLILQGVFLHSVRHRKRWTRKHENTANTAL